MAALIEDIEVELYVGDTSINKAYIGTTLVYEAISVLKFIPGNESTSSIGGED